MSDLQQPHLDTLTREECLELLPQAVVGRVGYVADGLAIIVPVNFTVLDGDIVFCVAKGRTLSWLNLRGRLSFQADENRTANHEGWSVLIHGVAREVTDPDELALLRRRPPHSWLRSPEEHWVRIQVESISGRALHGAAAGPPERTRVLIRPNARGWARSRGRLAPRTLACSHMTGERADVAVFFRGFRLR